ncbi:MAG: hypothetical protein NPIRA06_07180 [Nitrospirales bacterium]|nr:MAG: hypothetical protein NPIRA06_07180 [Nitrospirales bacterium]
MQKFMIEQSNIMVSHPGQIGQRAPGFIKGQTQVENHGVIVWMIFCGIGAEVFEVYRDKFGVDVFEESRWQPQGLGLLQEGRPRMPGVGTA